MLSKYICLTTFLISLSVGLFVVYAWGPETKEVIVFPTPTNMGKVQYKDKANNCFVYKGEEVECPTDESKISKIPVQQ